MNRIKRIVVILLTLLLTYSTFGCAQQAEKPSPKTDNTPPEQPKVVEELESDIIKIMTLSDKIPYFERVIVEKEQIEQEKKKEEMQMSQASGSTQGGSQGGSQNQEEGQGQQESQSKKEEKKPKPMTIAEGILDEILRREKTSPDQENEEDEKPPMDISETWKNINTTIKSVHDKWNVLEPLLIQESITLEVISQFEETLDILTNQGIQNKYFETLSVANKLTSYLPKFMGPFKKDVPPTVFTLKYLTRDVVLNSVVGSFDKAQESLNKIKEHGQNIKSQLIEKEAKATADKFDASVNNLQKSLEKKDLNLIKINGAIVMKNTMLMKDDLSSSL